MMSVFGGAVQNLIIMSRYSNFNMGSLPDFISLDDGWWSHVTCGSVICYVTDDQAPYFFKVCSLDNSMTMTKIYFPVMWNGSFYSDKMGNKFNVCRGKEAVILDSWETRTKHHFVVRAHDDTTAYFHSGSSGGISAYPPFGTLYFGWNLILYSSLKNQLIEAEDNVLCNRFAKKIIESEKILNAYNNLKDEYEHAKGFLEVMGIDK